MSEKIKTIMASKRETRQKLAKLSFTEKVAILEKLRDRSLAMRPR